MTTSRRRYQLLTLLIVKSGFTLGKTLKPAKIYLHYTIEPGWAGVYRIGKE